MTDEPNASHLVRQFWAENVRRRRKELGLSQDDVSTTIGWPQSVISEMENAKRRTLDPDLCLALCLALDVRPDDLFGWPVGITSIARYEQRRAA